MTYNNLYNINNWQKQIISGTIMGGSSIVKTKSSKNCYLSMRGKNGKWLYCKAISIGLMLPPNPFHLEANKYYRWHSACLPNFNEFHDIFYEDGHKVVKPKTLDSFMAIALTVWFLDAGSIKDECVSIKIRSFASSAKTICDYFENLGLNAKVIGYSISLDAKSSKKFMEIVGEYIPEFMLKPVTI